MLKNRGRDTRQATNHTPSQFPNRQQTQTPTATRLPAVVPSSTRLTLRTPVAQRAPIAKPEPDYEVVEFPSEQYVNAKLQPPPPPPPRPPTGHPAEAGASCGLCGGGGARVRCAECGRRALCASCDDMYHRHPKRRHHQRQALSFSQLRDERPPLPPKAAPPVPPPRRHKISGDRTSASPRPSPADQRNTTVGSQPIMQTANTTFQTNNHMSTLTNHRGQSIPAHLQGHIGPMTGHLGSVPYLPNMHVAPVVAQPQTNTLGHLASGWGRPRASLPGFNVPPNVQMAVESWENPENTVQGWGRPLRRGASVLELGGMGSVAASGACSGCAGWRYGSCASLDHQQWGWQPACCAHAPPPPPPHTHMHAPYTPQPYRRADSRTLSRAQSRVCSRAVSPAMSSRSRTSRRTRHRTPSPPALPSSDADSESESDTGIDRRAGQYPEKPQPQLPEPEAELVPEPNVEDSLGPAPAPPTASWQCEHCTFVNEPGVRVCVICCRTPTTEPKIINNSKISMRSTNEVSRSENGRSIAASERAVAENVRSIAQLDIDEGISNSSATPVRTYVQNGDSTKNKTSSKKERISTGCGPSPPRVETVKKPLNRLVTPTREQNTEHVRTRHDMGVGSSPPRDKNRTVDKSIRASPYRESIKKDTPRHNVSVGPSPPRDNLCERISPAETFQKKSTGTSPPRNIAQSRTLTSSTRANVSNTGTSPPPQSISTQTYEVPSSLERPASQSRSRRRFRDEARRERSHSRHSLSSDTRESERTSGGGGGGVGVGGEGRWEWRWGRDSSPGGEWSGSERRRAPARLARRASHLDLRRNRAPPPRRGSYYGSETASPEPTRAVSLEALAGSSAAAERGLELARLMSAAEQLGFSAAEVHAALAQSPAAPLAWLRARWAGLCAGVAAAVARLEPRARCSPQDARAALARHRGHMWPAVTECVDAHRRQAGGGGRGGGSGAVSGAARVSGRVWGSPAGAEDDAAPPRRAEGSSDEAEFRDDDWMYLPLDTNPKSPRGNDHYWENWDPPPGNHPNIDPDADADVNRLLVPSLDRMLIENLMSHDKSMIDDAQNSSVKPHPIDLIQYENDFIEAYNALTRSTPLPGIDPRQDHATEIGPKRDTYDVFDEYSRSSNDNAAHEISNKNLIVDQTPETIQDFIKIEKQNNAASIKYKFEETSADGIRYQTSLPPSTSNSHYETNIVGKTNDLTHSLNDTSSQAIMQINQSTEEGAPSKALNALSTIPINANYTPSQQSTEISKQINMSEEDNSNINIQVVTQQDEKIDNLSRIIESAQKPLQQIPSKQINVVVENNYNRNNESVRQDEKSNNLNDIVDTTQKLIQQMKEEINSDINSIDSRNISQSEADSSSNESSDISTEHESSYSESEDDESENQTSNDQASSANEKEEIQLSGNRPNIVQRTSSEDNDQFEEAMDHIEDQIKDFKNTNIEILDSIARSLQEEHTISIEVVDSKNVNNFKKEDKNNNLFVEVNNFDEIYAALNSGDKDRSEYITNKNRHNTQSKHNDNAMISEKLKTSLLKNLDIPKHQIVVSNFKVVSPTKLLFVENIPTIHNATIETLYDTINLPEETINKGNILEPLGIKEETKIILLNNSNHLLNKVDDDENETSNTADIKLLSKNINEVDNPNPIEEDFETEYNENSVIDLKNSNENLNIIEPPKQPEDVSTNNIDIKNIDASENVQIPTTESNNNVSNKISNSIKSNIPKFIKLVQGNKQKIDKSLPKVIASKVPIRRASLKQYPAPAPPKNHFGNIQIGHVKQLQTRLFNNKIQKASLNVSTTVEKPQAENPSVEVKNSVKVKTFVEANSSMESNHSVEPKDSVDVKPSTSTLNRKKQAPPPPVVEPVKAVLPKEKKGGYFRESCRTDDDWTDSDSDESQIQTVKTNDEPERAPSPPPPITLRRVSGHIIDLAKVQLPEGSPERQARMLLAQGATETWEQARLAVELTGRGAEPSAALFAALECADLSAALAYLHQDCELCAERRPEHEMVSMLRCTHRCCRECARHYFTVQITERSIADCVCPYCKIPDLENLPEDAWLEYFAHLDILLKTLLESDVHELFQRKLRDRTLARDPNFRWCMECSSGFFVHPKQKRVRCPECRSRSCAKCRKPWSPNHEGLTCEEYASWLEDNDPERAAAAVQQHLRDNGLECPRCHFKYSLSRGGCMHFTCTQCKYEFCNGCGKPFMMGARCGLSEYCAKLGLHAHHPRNCLFYLRDKEPHQLQTLLQMNDVPFETEAAEGSTNRCPIQLQRETPTGLVDGICGNEVLPKHAGLCKPHYVEYLAGRARALDPIPVMELPDLVAELRRRALPLPDRGPWDTDPIYAAMCAEIVKEKIPLD